MEAGTLIWIETIFGMVMQIITLGCLIYFLRLLRIRWMTGVIIKKNREQRRRK